MVVKVWADTKTNKKEKKNKLSDGSSDRHLALFKRLHSLYQPKAQSLTRKTTTQPLEDKIMKKKKILLIKLKPEPNSFHGRTVACIVWYFTE